MSDLQSFDPQIFLIYIGFTLASFAFLCNYLSFPKSLLKDLSNLICGKPPRITDGSLVNTKERRLQSEQIICFFYEIDVITFTILLFIVYSALVVLLLLGYNLGAVRVENTELAVVVLSFLHFGMHLYLAFIKLPKTRMRGEWRARDIYVVFDTLFSTGVAGGAFYIIYAIKSGTVLFLFLVGVLIMLYVVYLIPMALRMPVSNMLDLWQDLGEECESREKGSKTT